MAAITGSSVSGHLNVKCGLRPDGTPYLTAQDFRPPVHLGKAQLDAGALIVTIVNPTAGFFDGDQLQVRAEVEKGARLVLSTPSSSRVFRARGDQPARCEQEFIICSGAYLEWIPEAFIPHSGASYQQQTTIHLEQDADLLYMEWISPGRVARGEIFEFESIEIGLDLYQDDILIAREDYKIREAPEGITAMYPEGQYLAFYVVGKMTERWPAKEIERLGKEAGYLGHGSLEGGAKVIRAICKDAPSARKLIEDLRVLLHQNASLPVPALGRIFL